MIRSFLSALSFLTILPGLRAEISEKAFSRAPIWFPLVGYLIGTAGLGLSQIFLGWLSPWLNSFLLLLFLVILTGALHLDGLADWADSFAGKDPEQRLKIMKDSHHGTFGILALILVLLGKFLAIGLLIEEKNLVMLALAPGLARLSPTLILGLIPYARTEGGTGTIFEQGKRKWHLLFAFALAGAPVAILRSFSGLIGLGIVLLLSLVFAWDGQKRLRGFTGDLLGASIEICELANLLSAAVIL